MKKIKPFVVILLIAFFFRIVIMVWSFNFREHTDVLRHRDWARIAYLYNFADTYKADHLSFGTLPNNLPPGSLYGISAMYNLNIDVSKIILKITHAKEGSIQLLNGPLQNGFLRILSVIADIFTAFFIYKIVLKKSEKLALFAMSIFLFNPVIIYNSSFLGQLDAQNNLLFFISLYFLIMKKFFRSFISFFLSLYVKLSLLYFLPFMLLTMFLLMKQKIKLLLYSVVTATIILIITIPISNTPHIWLWNFFVKNSLGEMQNITAVAFNFWWMTFSPLLSIGKPFNAFEFSQVILLDSPLSNITYLGLSLNTWAFTLFSLSSLPFIVEIIKQKSKIIYPEKLFLLCSAIALTAFMFLPRMHDRFMFPLFALLATYIGTAYDHDKSMWVKFYISLSLLNLINLYFAWHPMLPPLIPYNIMSSRLFQWLISTITFGTFILFYIKSIKILKR